jgi:ketosteroid isomerase-like protein
MSQENVATALRAIDAWNRQDLEAFVDTWHPDAEWRMVGESLLVLGRICARGARSDGEIDSDWSAVLRFKEGKIISAWDWLDHEHALEAVGLSD